MNALEHRVLDAIDVEGMLSFLGRPSKIAFERRCNQLNDFEQLR